MAILDSARINSGNIIRQSVSNIYNLINSRSNVPDPNDDDGERKFVYINKLPNTTARNFKGFPFILVSTVRPTKRPGSASFSKSFIDYDVFITVYSQNKGHESEGTPLGAEMRDTISDSVNEALNSASNQKTLLYQGMGRIAFDMDFEEEDNFDDYNKTVFIAEFDVRFENNLTTTG